MNFEFPHGVPDKCIKWLWDNVGHGNISHSVVESNIRRYRLLDDDWYYARVRKAVENQNMPARYVPTIFIDDEKKAVLFALRWS